MRKATSRFSLLDRTIEITTNDPWCLELLSAAYGAMRIPAKGQVDHAASLMRESCGQLHLRFDSVEVPYENPLEEEPFRAASSALDTLFSRFAARVTGHLAIRASAVASCDGAVILVGPRGIGTSLLALHLVHLGAELLGDDLALLELPSRTVCAVPRLPRLREQALRYAPTRELRDAIAAAPHVYRAQRGRTWYALRDDDLAGIAPSTSVHRIRAVAVIDRRSADRPGVTRISADDALCGILTHALAGWQTLTQLSNLRRTLENVSCFSLSLAGPGETARLLTKALIARA